MVERVGDRRVLSGFLAWTPISPCGDMNDQSRNEEADEVPPNDPLRTALREAS
ncbi:hypothetical protein [Saccharopolyspora gloriosae]|uniref:hypothetical protein n=1 Tax=Saccharopolyspora gloriosae TaxID=455344 RepID=UPI001FB6B287|nr:hypothetical protein [Saccharopolyspora gloriosae]